MEESSSSPPPECTPRGVLSHVVPELAVPVNEDDPMLGQLWELLPDDVVPDDVVPLDVVVVVVVAANDA